MAMMTKNLLWSCAQIVAPRPPINRQRANQTAMEPTARRGTTLLPVTTVLSPLPERVLARGSSVVIVRHHTELVA